MFRCSLLFQKKTEARISHCNTVFSICSGKKKIVFHSAARVTVWDKIEFEGYCWILVICTTRKNIFILNIKLFWGRRLWSMFLGFSLSSCLLLSLPHFSALLSFPPLLLLCPPLLCFSLPSPLFSSPSPFSPLPSFSPLPFFSSPSSARDQTQAALGNHFLFSR